MDPRITPSLENKYVPPFEIRQEISYRTRPVSTMPSSPDPDIIFQMDKRYEIDSQSDAEIPGDPVLHNQSIAEYLHQQLSVKRLNDIHQHLWLAGRSFNIRSLHRQRMMHREIIITEDPSLHLVWYDSTIYIKPLPLYLLRWKFFAEKICPDGELYEYALGFLSTYAALVQNQSDFRIAREMGLVPDQVTWTAWSSLATTLAKIERDGTNMRYRYGELQLQWLNHISILSCGRMYSLIYTQYDFSRTFALLALIFAYVSVVLSAMQVVLATDNVPATFKAASYGFGIFTIVAVGLVVAVGVGVLMTLSTFLFVYLFWAALKYHRR